ncbi:MAG: UvrB/UvrC motif-containing protein [Phycisphaerae bacterium]|jgi:protein arginine kinase activator
MDFKCDKCEKPATVYLTEIHNGKKIEKHLCETCAATEGITIQPNVSISQLLEEFVLHTGPEDELARKDLTCDVCGLSFSEFRQQKLLGCPHDYDAFERLLLPLVERAQGGASQHVGKVPHKAGNEQKKHNALLRLRGDLKGAITSEDYERAAMLRDQIKELENT